MSKINYHHTHESNSNMILEYSAATTTVHRFSGG